ncbi:MAG TPA: DmsE family decaheme c-type cytochrome [Terracidiphilus sp.]|nr:DmsE family decaheme c-type cytochrome [Terracidiphilus sp.]
MAMAAPGAKPAAGQDKHPNASEFVGSETCATCHEEVVKGFATNPHTKMAQMHGSNGVTCENCHGAGKAHVDGGGDVTKIFNPAKAPEKEVTAKCLACHAGQHANFSRSPHAKADVGCTSCHSVHHSEDKVQLLRASETTLCFQCHNDVKPQFSMPFHHKVIEGVTRCSDCHDPHGTFQGGNLRSTAAQNAVCTKCHSETGGPFVYEHPVVKTEGCLSCHSPHGSQNARLLNVSNINTLCLQCHSATNSAAFPHAVSPTGPVHNQAAQYTPCITCHSQIHGSNASNIYFK